MSLHNIWLTESTLILDLLLRIYFCVRVVQRRIPAGVAWAWIVLILFFPFVGNAIYFYLGEYRLGRRRKKRLIETDQAVQQIFLDLERDHHAQIARTETSQEKSNSQDDSNKLTVSEKSFARAVNGFFKSPLLGGNAIELLRDADTSFIRMIEDLDRAQISCDIEFYIWSDGGRADDFGEALIRASQRGVRCRLLVDQIGSASFINQAMAKKIKKAGVELCVAMPSGLIRSVFARPDLRLHRKIIVIDGSVAYTGSMNLADPLHFKIEAGIGPWVDALCRVRGPIVQALNLVMLSDWCVEKRLDFLAEESKLRFLDTAEMGHSKIQCVPSGPAINTSAIEQVLIMAIYAARHRLVLTTPYFIPSEAFLFALIASARRGVHVTLIVPEKVDSKLISFASRSYLRELVDAGVSVALYQDGMLHTKSVSIDGELSIFGSLNLDPRSLRINFEITLIIYDDTFTHDLEALQKTYRERSRLLTSIDARTQSWPLQFTEDLTRLAGPLL